MRACKSLYDYGQLISNYVEFNTNTDITYNNNNPLPEKFISTANNRLSFNNEYYISYSTPIAKFIKTKNGIYIFITNVKYSNTTSKQCNQLKNYIHHYNQNTDNRIIVIPTENINNSFKEILEEKINTIKTIYKRTPRLKVGTVVNVELQILQNQIQDILPELHYKTITKTQKFLYNLPKLPAKINKFIRPALLSILKEKGLL